MISLLLSLGLLLTPAAHAAMSAQCQSAMTMQPVGSRYVGKVLQRANDGLQNARNEAVASDFSQSLQSWIDHVGSAWNKRIDSAQRLTDSNSDLTRKSACFRFDLILLECKMDEIRDEMNKELVRGSWLSILKLEDLLDFVDERYRQLSRGGLDPQYADPTWGGVYSFDTPAQVVCCDAPGQTCRSTTQADCDSVQGKSFVTQQECVQGGCMANANTYSLDEEMCPYDADYAPPNAVGYGCDMDVLNPIGNFPPLTSEIDATRLIQKEIEKQRTAAQQFLGIQQEIDSLFGQSATLPPPTGPREHRSASGCMHRENRCAGSHDVQCQTTPDCKDGSNCIPMPQVCKGNRNLGCFDDTDCQVGGTSFGPCTNDDGGQPISREVRGPFSLTKNPITLMQDFLAKRIADAQARSFPDDLKEAGEFSSDQSSLAAQRADEGAIFAGVRAGQRALWRVWSGIQGRREAITFAVATDPQLQVAHELVDLSDAISKLSQFATKKDGIRAFVIRFAAFLRRTCIHRACNASLDEILKITFQDSCFPYTDGDYLGDSESSPRSDKCKQDAQL